MRKNRFATILISLTVPATLLGAGADTVSVYSPSVINRIMLHEDMMPSMSQTAFENPALKQWERGYSYSDISAGYRYGKENKAVDVQRGSGYGIWGFDADSYIKYKSSTLWGSAGYHNGRQRGVNWNESSDADIIYPYFTADSIGGNLHVENYNFAGGYADHNDRWSWGAAVSYNAGLYFRNVDPRPRNTTSRLDIALGGAMRIGSSQYNAGISVNYRKYKQSCDIEFVNELSDNSIWHITGLGTHYERFASNGYSHYYNGYRWGGTANLFPSNRRGAVASVSFQSFTFDHILTSLNKLPLESATDNAFGASLGWLAPGNYHDFAATLKMTHSKRTGTENIFGDGSGNVYPKIGSLDLYSHTLTAVTADLLWQWHPGVGSLLSIKPRASWSRSMEKYHDPRRHLLLSSVMPAVTARGARSFGNAWQASLTLDFAYSVPVDNNCYLPYNSSIPAGLQDVDVTRYNILSKSYTVTGISASVARSVNDRNALSISASYLHKGFTAGVHANSFDLSLSFIF